MYKSDWEKATQAERLAKKDVLKLQFQNDELNERHKYMERKYLQLVQRVGASQEDLEAVEVIMASGTGDKNLPKLKNLPGSGMVNKDRIPSRHQQTRGGYDIENSMNNYYVQGSNQRTDKNMSGSKGKKNIVEVLDFDSEAQSPNANQYYHKNDGEKGIEMHAGQAALLQVNNSDELLKKLIDNIQNNQSLQNESVRNQFKLDLITSEENLH